MQCFVYVLRSLKDQSFYTGISENPDKRLKEHNKGLSKYTKGHKPYKLIYQEACDNRQLARNKEEFYKTGAGREILRRIIPL